MSDSVPQQLNPLHAATDTLNKALSDAEKRLQGLGLGVPARVLMIHADAQTHLVFAKDGGEFRLMVENGAGHLTPLTSTSRTTRLLAAHHLKPLHEALLGAVKEETDAVLEAIRVVDYFLAELEDKP